MPTPIIPAHPCRGRPRSVLALSTLLIVLMLSACSAGSEGAGDSAGGRALSEGAGVDEGADAGAGTGASDDAAAAAPQEQAAAADVVPAQAAAAAGRMIARDATVSLVVKDFGRSASQVRAAAAASQGYVVSEEVTPPGQDDSEDGYATFVLSVPSQSLDEVVAQVSTLGTVATSTMVSQDVTERYVDTTARIETLQASVDRVRDLLGGAGTVKDIVALERELSTREADLDALRAVQQSLEADVSRSSLTVDLHTDEAAAITEQDDANGFLAGLRSGWSAFGVGTAALLTGVGALLPFALTLAVLLLPVLWWHRRRATGSGATRPGPDSTAGPGQLRA